MSSDHLTSQFSEWSKKLTPKKIRGKRAQPESNRALSSCSRHDRPALRTLSARVARQVVAAAALTGRGAATVEVPKPGGWNNHHYGWNPERHHDPAAAPCRGSTLGNERLVRPEDANV